MTTHFLSPVAVGSHKLTDAELPSFEVFFHPEGDLNSGFMIAVKEMPNCRSGKESNYLVIKTEKNNYTFLNAVKEANSDILHVEVSQRAVYRLLEEFTENGDYVYCVFRGC